MAQGALPHQGERVFLTDGGMETTLIFHDGLELPHFAAFDLLRTPAGRARIEAYYLRYLAIALERRCGFILETPTWRASPDWGELLGYDAAALANANRAAVMLLADIRTRHADAGLPVLVSGCVGPRGDGYAAGVTIDPAAAQAYHQVQIAALAAAGVDLVTALTLGSSAEAIGIAHAAAACGKPCVIGFTVETDGSLPNGETLGSAIAAVDAAGAVAYFMINCAHPEHFAALLAKAGAWKRRIGGVRANASMLSHAELDNATELDAGDPEALAAAYRDLLADCPEIRVLGGCCGTDHRHVEAIARACC